MKLETAKSLSFDPVTEAQLRQAFRDDANRGEFIILASSSSTQDQRYIQAGGDGDGPFRLEYRDGDEDRHFEAPGDWSKADVERAFLSYLAGDGRWKTGFPWQKMVKKPWWKFW